ncbi:MAG: murein biosynthesis integral membrane protein MurJ [Chloroflexota bacterium]
MARDLHCRSLHLENRSTIAKAAGIIMLGNIISRLLGLVREQVIAALFGTRIATDIFVVASTVPTMVYDLLVSGAISAALIPVFTSYADKRDREEFGRIISVVMSMAAVALALVVAFLILVAPLLVDVLGAGFDEEARALTTYLVRLMLPSVLFMGTAGILTAALYARQSFALPAFSVAIFNLGIILGGVLLAGRLHVSSLVIGVLLGTMLQVAIQLPGMKDIRLRPAFDLSHPAVITILKLYAPVALGLIVSNMGVIIDRYLASQTGEGSLAAMRFATTLVQFPLGLVATATSFAVLPTLSRQATGEAGGEAGAETRGQGDEPHPRPLPHRERGLDDSREERELGDSHGERGDARNSEPRTQNAEPSSALRTQHSGLRTQDSSYSATLLMGIKMILVLIVPAAVGLAVLREPIIQLLFQRGEFDPDATALTALAFLGYSPGIAFAAVDQMLIFAFYARKDTKTPVLVGVLAIFVYLGVALTLIRPLGMLGLVLANAVQNTSHALVLLWLLNRRVQGLVSRDLGIFLAKVVGASGVMGLSCHILLVAVGPLADSGPEIALLVAGGAAIGMAVYLVAVLAMRVQEARDVGSLLLSRMRCRGVSS